MHSLEGVLDDKVLISDFYLWRYVSGSDSLDSQVDPALGGKYYLQSSWISFQALSSIIFLLSSADLLVLFLLNSGCETNSKLDLKKNDYYPSIERTITSLFFRPPRNLPIYYLSFWRMFSPLSGIASVNAFKVRTSSVRYWVVFKGETGRGVS